MRCCQFPRVILAIIAVTFACGALLGLGGCASGDRIGSAAQLIEPGKVGLGGIAAGNNAPAIASDWWRGFGDATLDKLVDRALADNPNLRVAATRLSKAENLLAGAQAAAGPRLDGATDVSRQRFSANGIYPPPLGGATLTLGNAQLDASWELDFFGRNRAAIEAAVGLQRAQQADLQAARTVLAAMVVRTYVQLGRLFEQREIAQRALTQRDEMLTLIRQRVQSGLDTRVELRQGEGAVPESRQQVELLEEQIALARHALGALTAQAPNALDALVVRLHVVQAVPVPASVPVDLLGRRADIAAARWRVEAAVSDRQSAEAAFYPNVNLTAFIGLSSIGLNQLARASSEQFGIGPALRLPIFDAGRLRANLRARTADLDAAIESYNGAVIEAVHDAADQIASLRSIARQQADQDQALTAAEAAYALATQRYRAGLGNYLIVLSAETPLLNQRRQAADLKARLLDSQIGLMRALGGGYSADNTAVAGGAGGTPPGR